MFKLLKPWCITSVICIKAVKKYKKNLFLGAIVLSQCPVLRVYNPSHVLIHKRKEYTSHTGVERGERKDLSCERCVWGGNIWAVERKEVRVGNKKLLCLLCPGMGFLQRGVRWAWLSGRRGRISGHRWGLSHSGPSEPVQMPMQTAVSALNEDEGGEYKAGRHFSCLPINVSHKLTSLNSFQDKKDHHTL